MYQVPLSRLYQIMASCQYDEGAKFCPVLVKINDDDIQANNNGCGFLLQVWTLKGEMIYEKPLDKPISNWNISEDTLLFTEEVDSTDVWLIKLFEDKQPIVYRFTLPNLHMSKKVNSVYDAETQNFKIPTE